MTSDINICNMALGNIGAEPIISFEDESQTARICKMHYEHVIDYLLAGHPWGFNRRLIALIESSETKAAGWNYLYVYPVEALNINRIFSAKSSSERSDFIITLGEKRRIACNLPPDGSVYAECRVAVEDVSLWPPQFVEVVVWLLASRLALSLARSSEVAQSCVAMYQQALGEACALCANESHNSAWFGSSWLEGRD
ncbi:MAG: hypothetical protein RRY12_10775 [Cloacibacillus sp.]